MAIIKKITKKEENYVMKGRITCCNAQYNDCTNNEEKFVRIQTFGCVDRIEEGKQSQVIHISKEMAKQLISLLKESFNL